MSRYERPIMSHELSPEAVQNEVEKILSSDNFARSKRLRSLLRFTVAQTLQGNAETLKEYVIGTEVLKKPDSYDPRSDSLVRVLASRLRVKLKEYYSNGGSDDPLVIEFPKGKYVPRFQRREQLQTEIEKKLRARNAYSLGKFVASKFSEQALAQAAEHFQEAIEVDPNWSLPHVGLANVYAFEAFLGFRRPREIWPVVRAQAEYTLQLDEMSSEAHICLGMAYALFDWRWRDAESHFQKAIERDSYSGAGHVWRALAVLIPMGKLAAATDELAKARELAPAPFLEEAEVLAQYFGEQYDAVLEHTARRAEAGPMPAWLPWVRSCALAGLGKTARKPSNSCRSWSREIRTVRESSRRWATCTGWRASRTRLGRSLVRLKQRREHGDYVSNYDLALVEAALGNRNEAVAVLQEALREREPWVVFLGVDPRMAALRTSPKFTSLVRRIVLTEGDAFQLPAHIQQVAV